jgi:hypothetical protein
MMMLIYWLGVASKETGLEVNAEKGRYTAMSRGQNAGQNSNIHICNKSFEIVKQFKYLGRTLTNQNSIYEVSKIRLKSGNACYHSVQNLLPSSLPTKNATVRYTEL